MGDNKNSFWSTLGAIVGGVAVGLAAAGAATAIYSSKESDTHKYGPPAREVGQRRPLPPEEREGQRRPSSQCSYCNEDTGAATVTLVCGHTFHEACFVLANVDSDEQGCPTC